MRACLVSAVALGLVSAVFALPAQVGDDCEDHVITDPQSTPYPESYPDTSVEPVPEPPVYTVYYSQESSPQPSEPCDPSPYPESDPQDSYPSVTPYPSITPYPVPYPEVVPTAEEPCNDETSPEPVTYPSAYPEPYTAPTEDTTTYSGPTDSFTQSYLSAHNNYRKKHGAPPLSYDAAMASYAQSHVDNGGCHMQHSHPHTYGENLGIGFSDITSCIKMWYEENSSYSYAHGGFSTSTGHFTQVVWKGATKIGCGKAKCGKSYYISCNYDHGNIIGQFQDNVFPPKY